MPDNEPTAAVTPHAILVAARDAIATPERWTQGCAALEADGNDVSTERSDVVRRCMLDAVWYGHYKCRADAGLPEIPAHSDPICFDAEQLLAAACRERGVSEAAVQQFNSSAPDVEAYNDDPDRTHAEVLAAFDDAIAAA